MSTAPLSFRGILFFPVTPFDAVGDVDLDILATHVASRLPFTPGGVFPACGTGEIHALSESEAAAVVRTTVETVRSSDAPSTPVVAGAGGSLGTARAMAVQAQKAGADALLILPPYLVQGPISGTIAYVEDIARASDLPVIVYHRGGARFTAEAMAHLARNPKVIGFKDGTGDIGLAQEIALAVRAEGRDDFQFFNGLLTAELSQGAYRALGMPLYSSAAFAMAPEIALEHYDAYSSGDEERRLAVLDAFYAPLVRLRDQTPGFGVSLIKAGLRLGGLPVGSVRPPLVDPTPAQLDELERILEVGHRFVEARAETTVSS